MAEEKQKLTIESELRGGKETADGLGKIQEAQDRVVKGTGDAKKPVDDLKESQDKLNASEGDFVAIMSRVNPEFGLMADLGLKATKVLNQMGDGTVSVGGAMSSLRNVLGENIGLIKMFAAGGAVVAGFAAIAHSVAAMREEFERAVEQMNKLRDAQTKMEQERTASATDIGRAALAQGITLTVEQQRALGQRVEGVAGKMPGLDPMALQTAAASLGAGATPEDIQRVAMGLQMGPQAGGGVMGEPGETPQSIQDRFRRLQERNPQQWATFQQSISVGSMRQDAGQRARREIQGGGSVAAMAEFIRLNEPDMSQERAEEIARIAQGLEATRGMGAEDVGIGGRAGAWLRNRWRGMQMSAQEGRFIPTREMDSMYQEDIQRQLLEGEGLDDLSPVDINRAEQARNRIMNVTVNNVNTRRTVPARGSAPSNGDSSLDDAIVGP